MALTEICRSQLNDRNNDFAFHDPSTDSFDCNVAMCSQAVELVTGSLLTSQEVRARGQTPGPNPTGNALARRVFKTEGMIEGTDFIIFRDQPTQTIRDLLSTDWFVVGYVRYGKIAELAPEMVSDGYKEAHAIGLADWWQRGFRKCHFYDPLADGRYSGSLKRKVAKGMQTIAFSVIREAMWAYSEKYENGTGLVSGYAVKPRT